MTTLLLRSTQNFRRTGPSPLETMGDYGIYERAVLAVPELVGWWRADSRIRRNRDGYFTWLDMKADRKLRQASTAVPTVTAAIIGGKPVLTFGLVTKRLLDPDAQAFLPLTGDWTVVTAGLHAEAANWNVYGNAGTAGNFNVLTRRTDRRFAITQGGTAIGTSAVVHTTNAPFYAVDSWEQSATRRILRVNATQELSVVTALAVANSQIVVGAAQSGGSGPGGTTSAISDVMIFNKPLAAAAYAASLATIEAYFPARYGSVFG